MTQEEAEKILAAIAAGNTNTELALDNAIAVYRHMGAEIETIEALRTRAKAVVTEIMQETGQLKAVMPSGTALFTEAGVRTTWDNKALNALCASNDELERILSPHRKVALTASTLVIR